MEGAEVAGGGGVFRWSGWMQLRSVEEEYEIARIDAVEAGGCTVDDLTINPRAPPFKSDKVLHKHEIPLGMASEEPVYANTEFWKLSCAC